MKDENENDAQFPKVLTRLQQRNAELEKENSHYKNLVKNQTEIKLRRLTSELAILTKLNDAVNRGDSLKQLVRLLSREVRKFFACQGASILLLNSSTNHLIFQNPTLSPALTKRMEELLGIEIPNVELSLNNSSYYAQVLKSGEPRLVKESETVRNAIIEYIEATDFINEKIRARIRKLVPQIQFLLGIKSGISVPLISEGRVIGVLDIFTKKTLDESDIEWANKIGVQFASIIKRKQLEEELRKEEKLLRETQKISRVGGWEFDLVSGKGKMTETTFHIYEVPVGQEISAEAGIRFYPERVRPQIREAFDQLLQKGKPYDLELPFVTAKGKKRWVRTTAKAEKKGGKVVRIYGNLMDITESRRARDTAIKSEKRYHQLFENSPVPLWEEDFTALFQYLAHLKESGIVNIQKYIDENPQVIKDCIRKIKVLDVNKAVLELYQPKDKKELLRNPGKAFSRGSIHVFKNEVLAFARGEKDFEAEEVVQTLAGEQRHLLLKISIEENSANDETTYRGLVSTVDITERVRMENALAESKQRLQQAQHVARMGFLDWDLKTNDIFLSNGIYELYGLKNEGKLKTPDFVAQVVHPDDLEFVKRELDLAVRGLKHYDIDHRIVRPDGEVIWVNAQAELAHDETGAPLTLLGTVVDITARKRTEEILKLSEERFRLAFQTSPDSININRMEDGMYVDINDGFTAITGYTREDVIGKTSLEINIWDDPKDRARLVEGLKKNGRVNNLEAKFRMKDGRVVTGLISAGIIMLGHVPHILTVTRSIEELKQAERALKESEQRFRGMIDQAGDAMFLSDLKGRIIDVNIMACKSLGYSRKELLSKKVQDVDPEFISMKHRSRYWEQLVPGMPMTVTSIHKRKNGSTFPVEIRTGILEIKGQKLILGFARDITKRKQAEAALQLEKDRAEKYLNIIGVMMLVLDSEGRVTLINDKGCEILGYKREQIIGKNWFDNFLPPSIREQVISIYDRIMAGEIQGDSYYGNLVLTKSGEERNIAWRNVLLRDEKGDPIGTLSAGDDVTERLKVESALSRYREQLQNLSAHLQFIREEERAHIAREMHDELGQRLTVLKMDVSLLMKELAEKEAFHKKAQSMLNMIDDTIRVVQKMSSELKPSILEEFGLIAAIKQQLIEFEKHSDTKYELRIDIHKDHQFSTKLATAIFRIFQESITNVLRHAHATKVKIEMSHTNGNFLMRIQDNGIGIPPEKLSDPASLGIIGMRERMFPWDGKVHIKSTPEKGTTIMVNVPLGKQEKTADD